MVLYDHRVKTLNFEMQQLIYLHNGDINDHFQQHFLHSFNFENS